LVVQSSNQKSLLILGLIANKVAQRTDDCGQAGGESGIRTRGTVIRLCARRLADASANVIASGDSVAILPGKSGLCVAPNAEKFDNQKSRRLLSFLFAVAPYRTMKLYPPFHFRSRLIMMFGMINTSRIFSIGENTSACTSSGRS
jgi:hypothetical protein